MNFEIQAATSADLAWIKRVGAEAAVDSLPSTRRLSPAALQARARANLGKLQPDEELQIWIAWHAEKRVRAGFLVLQLHQKDENTGEPQSVIYDLVVVPKFRGSRAVRDLVMHARDATRAAGLRAMVGEITADNRRAVLRAERLGFQLERYIMVMDCN